MKQFTFVFMMAIMGALVLSVDAQAQKMPGLDKSPMDAASFPRRGEKVAKIYYSRPQLKGRELAELAPNGKVWRTGANEAPEITFYKDVKIGGKTVKAGTYSVFTIPNDKEWTLVLNTELNQWGAYQYSSENDILRAKGKVSTTKSSVEAFAMTFEKTDKGVNLLMAWGTVKVSFPIKF